jgi:hypothetical protein
MGQRSIPLDTIGIALRDRLLSGDSGKEQASGGFRKGGEILG